MKQKDIPERNKIWKEIWDKYQANYAMDRLAYLLTIPLTTFYRGIKDAEKKGRAPKRVKTKAT